MKTIPQLILTAAVGTFTLAGQAHEALLSPRARALQPHVAAGRHTDVNLVNADYLGAATKFQPAKVKASPGIDRQAIQAQGPLYTGKDPIRELRKERVFELAPLAQPDRAK